MEVKVVRYEFFDGSPTLRFASHSPRCDTPEPKSVCCCTQTTAVRPAGVPTSTNTIVTLTNIEGGATFTGTLSYRDRGPQPYLNLALHRDGIKETSFRFRTKTHAQVCITGIMGDVFFGPEHDDDDFSCLRMGHSAPSPHVVNLRNIGADSVWTYASNYGGHEAFREICRDPERADLRSIQQSAGEVIRFVGTLDTSLSADDARAAWESRTVVFETIFQGLIALEQNRHLVATLRSVHPKDFVDVMLRVHATGY